MGVPRGSTRLTRLYEVLRGHYQPLLCIYPCGRRARLRERRALVGAPHILRREVVSKRLIAAGTSG
eukprot:scaffold90512_cov72-Phaeocystis_antarctica.AAC.1